MAKVDGGVNDPHKDFVQLVVILTHHHILQGKVVNGCAVDGVVEFVGNLDKHMRRVPCQSTPTRCTGCRGWSRVNMVVIGLVAMGYVFICI